MTAFRVIFAAAAAYNVAFGTWAAFYPGSFFALFELPPPRYPSIWACLGMVIGIYGAAYAYVAWRPDRGTVLALIGLAGKVLGPAGWLAAVWNGELPAATFPLILANDLIWWFPFAFYLLRAATWRRTIVAGLCVALNAVACVALLAVGGGTELVPDMGARSRWVAEAVPLWTTAWFAWSLASLSLLAFFVVWGTQLVELAASWAWIVASYLVCALGVLFDLSGEAVNVAVLTRPGLSVEEFAAGARLYAILGPAIANGLYAAAGFTLSAVSWRAGFLQGWLGALGICMWLVAAALTTTAVLDLRQGMVATGAAVMMLFLPWSAAVAWRLRPAQR